MILDGPQIKFISDGARDCPFLQIAGTDFHGARELFHTIRGMRDRMTGSFNLNEVHGFENCKAPSLSFEVTETDQGIVRLSDEDHFRCLLSYDGWIKVEDLLAPFCRRDSGVTGFQWLDDSSEISLLFSPSGGW